ncbi:MAG: IS1595 family transposase [candidate division Zixibacteria bacterium]|nr:IS1595 family transposase [candidate division Zixibacteria bacterium]
MLYIPQLIDNARCYDEVRRMRWPNGVRCPGCTSNKIAKRGKNHRHQECRRYRCKKCGKQFDDLTGTIFAKHHQPLKIWIICLYMMWFNIPNRQIAQELDLNESDMQEMTSLLRGILKRRRPPRLEGETEIDEVYVVAGHKGRPDRITGRKGRRNRLKGARGRGTLEKEKPPIFGMIQRDGEVCITMLENVQQKTIMPLITATVAPGTTIYTDEYDIYNRLSDQGYEHKTVCHSRGEYARDEDGDGFHEVHVNTMEGFWSLLRSWLRPHRGISQEKLPIYLGFFEFVHNARQRGKALLGSLIERLLQPA